LKEGAFEYLDISDKEKETAKLPGHGVVVPED